MVVERKLVAESKKRVLLREYLAREAERAGFGGVEIQRTPMGTRITLIAERPGFVIGRRGATIKRLTDEVQTRFGLDNPQIEVLEAPDPSLNPQIMAQKLAEALERGWHFRRAGHSTLRRIMEGGAKGVLITISGKITGGRSRAQKFVAGHIKHCGEPALLWMHHGHAVARKKLGTIGVKVSIMDPHARLPDDIDVGVQPGVTPTPVGAVPAAAAAAPAESAVPPGSAAPAAQAAAKRPAKLTDLPGIGDAKEKSLEAAGYSDVEALRSISEEALAGVEGIGPKLAKKIKQEIGKWEP